jgi:hypothetical protein
VVLSAWTAGAPTPRSAGACVIAMTVWSLGGMVTDVVTRPRPPVYCATGATSPDQLSSRSGIPRPANAMTDAAATSAATDA